MPSASSVRSGRPSLSPSLSPARGLALAALVAGAACGPSSFAGPPEAEIGTGASGFLAITDGDAVPIERGTQGGYHVWGAARARWLDPEGVVLEFTLTLDGETTPRSVRRQEVDLRGGDGGRAFGEHGGTTVFLADPDEVRGRACRFALEVRDRVGRRASSARTVIPTDVTTGP